MARLAFVLLCAGAALAQTSEVGRVERDGREAVLTVEGPRPLDLAAMTIVREFGIPVSCEDPPYVYKDDVKDVTAAVSRVPNLPRRVLIPKGGRLEVRFALREDGSPEDIRGLLQALVDQADARFPWAYRLDADRGSFTLVPMKTRDAAGNVVAATPLMDRRVTIPPGERMVTESAKLMADGAEQLDYQTVRKSGFMAIPIKVKRSKKRNYGHRSMHLNTR
jgi:hypothetical protein